MFGVGRFEMIKVNIDIWCDSSLYLIRVYISPVAESRAFSFPMTCWPTLWISGRLDLTVQFHNLIIVMFLASRCIWCHVWHFLHQSQWSCGTTREFVAYVSVKLARLPQADSTQWYVGSVSDMARPYASDLILVRLSSFAVGVLLLNAMPVIVSVSHVGLWGT